MNKYGEPWEMVAGRIKTSDELPSDDDYVIRIAASEKSYRACACATALAGIEDPQAFVERVKSLIDGLYLQAKASESQDQAAFFALEAAIKRERKLISQMLGKECG